MGMLTLFITSADGIKTCSVLEYRDIETSLEPVPLAQFHFASPACSRDSWLARGSTPWTPGGYIPIPITLLIPAPTIFLIPVPTILLIPASTTINYPVVFISIIMSIPSIPLSYLHIYLLSQQSFFCFPYFPVYITSHSYFTYNTHFIIFLSIVCHIFTSPHSCVLL